MVCDVSTYAAQRRLDIARRIRSACKRVGWIQEDVANYLGCSRAKANRVERGLAEFGIVGLELLAQALDIPLAQLLDSAGRDTTAVVHLPR